MSEEGRILRLENAIATLGELAARQQRLSEEQQRQAAEQQRRTARLEESFVIVTEMLRRHDDTFDELRAAQAETEHKIAALIGAQIRIEEAHTRGVEELRATVAGLAEVMKQLAESQAHADRRLDGLTDIVRDLRGGRGGDGSLS